MIAKLNSIWHDYGQLKVFSSGRLLRVFAAYIRYFGPIIVFILMHVMLIPTIFANTQDLTPQFSSNHRVYIWYLNLERELKAHHDQWAQKILNPIQIAKEKTAIQLYNHAAPKAELYFQLKESSELFFIKWFKKIKPRSSREHLQELRDLLTSHFNSESFIELKSYLIQEFKQAAYRVFDISMHEIITHQYTAFNDVLRLKEELGQSQLLSPFELQELGHQYLLMWEQSAIWYLVRENLINTQIEKNFWKGEVFPEHFAGTDEVQECRIAFLHYLGKI